MQEVKLWVAKPWISGNGYITFSTYALFKSHKHHPMKQIFIIVAVAIAIIVVVILILMIKKLRFRVVQGYYH